MKLLKNIATRCSEFVERVERLPIAIVVGDPAIRQRRYCNQG
jgi:hypothetical protein